MLKKAMIMAAGVGSRLEPLSSIVPKPMVPLANKPAMDILIQHLSKFGIRNIVANTYYKAEEIQNYYKENNFGINFNFIKETELSGTAGGLKKCQFFFNEKEDFIVMSGDGLTDLDINKAYEAHVNSNAIATIILKEVEHSQVNKYGIVVLDEDNSVKSFQEKPAVNEAKSNLANTGIYIFKYDIFNLIPENTFFDFAKNVFPMLLNNKIKINTYVMEGYWSDIGSLDQYHQSNIDLLNHAVNSYKPVVNISMQGLYIKGDNTQIKNDIKIQGYCILGNNCKIGNNVKIINSILWNNIDISDNVVIENSIILSNSKVNEPIKGQIVKEDITKEHTYASI